MTKAIKFYKAHSLGSLYFMSEIYIKWLNDNQNIKVISVIYDDGTLLVTYEEGE